VSVRTCVIQCSMECREGVRTRAVSCRDDVTNMLLPNSECMAADRPTSTLSCSDIFNIECSQLTPIYGVNPYGDVSSTEFNSSIVKSTKEKEKSSNINTGVTFLCGPGTGQGGSL